MKRISKRFIYRIVSAIMWSVLIVMSSGCSVIEDPSKNCPELSDGASLSFRVISAARPTNYNHTRTDDNNHDEEDSRHPDVEDFVNVEDFAFYIFVATSSEDTNPSLFYACTSLEGNSDISYTGSAGIYDVNLKISEEKMKGFFGDNYNIGSTPVYFRILAVANSHASRNVSNTLAPEGAGPSKLNDMVAEVKKLEFSLSQDTQMAFPMYGLGSRKQSNIKTLSDSRPENPVYLGTVSLLRAVAKVRVADNITKNDNGYPKIESVSFTYTLPQGFTAPINAENYVDGTQVHDCNIPAQDAIETNTVLTAGNENVTTDTETKNMDVWYGYCPEQIIGDSNPSLVLSVRTAEGVAPFPVTVPLSGYNGKDFVWTGSEGQLLRNHIYTLSVSMSNKVLVITVCPRASFTTDIPTFE